MRGRLALALAIALALMPALFISTTPRARAAATYTITDLGPLLASDINDAGQVVGSYEASDGTSRAYVWQSGVRSDLGTSSGASARAINAAGQVVGQLADHGFYWHDGVTTDLGTFGGRFSGAQDINDAGQVVGGASGPDGGSRAYLWQNGLMTPLGTLPGATLSSAAGINNAGQIVGIVPIPPANTFMRTHLVLWQNGSTIADLADLGGAGALSPKINDLGQIIGNSDASGMLHGFLYDAGKVSDLGTLGGQISIALGINNTGQVVGTAETASQIRHAFLYSVGAITDLNNLIPSGSGWELAQASAINNRGQIVGSGMLNGQSRAFLLTPIGLPPQAPPLPPGTAPECFPQSGKCMRSLFADYWQAHGGLAINGYPISNEFTEVLEDGKPYTVQYFERVRMEYHPENPPPYDVELGQFGRRILAGVPNAPTASVPAKAGYTFFQQTGHNVSPRFVAYWNANGGLAQFGYPLSEEFTQTLEAGKPYLVQYFERARFEYHPENQPPYDVELGQFGRRILGNR